MKNKLLIDCLELYIDHRGLTPGKLNTHWSKRGYRVLSANNVKNEGITNTEEIRFTDAITYKKWMKVEIQRNDILMTSEAPAGEIYLWNSDEKIVLGQRLYALRTNKEVDPKYLTYYLKSATGKYEIEKNRSGSTVFGISAKIFDYINVILPETFKEQQRIGQILFLIDSKIENNININTELEAMAKTIYDYWFVQFDFPDNNGKPYKSSGGKMVWNEVLKQSIPEHGQYKADVLSSIACINNINFNPRDNEVELIEYYSIPAYDSGMYPIIEKGGNISSNKYSISNGDILVSKLNPQFRRVWDPYCFTDKAVCSTEFIVYHSTKKDSRGYLLSLINSEKFRKLLVNNSSSSTGSRKRLSPEDTLKFVFAVPGDDLQKKYHSIISPLYGKIKSNIIENHMLAEIRDFLLPMLMNGQVTVKP